MSGLETTFDLLRSDQSDAAQAVWLAALVSERRTVREHALRATFVGSPVPVQRAVIRAWKQIDDDDRRRLGESIDRFLPGLRQSLAKGEANERNAAIGMALSLRIHALVPDLVQLMLSGDDELRESAARVTLRLVQSLDREAVDADGRPIRHRAIASLEQALRRYLDHRRPEIIAAFALLADADSATLLALLEAPNDLGLAAAAKELLRSDHEALPDRLVADFLVAKDLPESIVRLWASRSDRRFLETFLSRVASIDAANAKRNLGRLRHLEWLDERLTSLPELSVDAQLGLVALVETAKLGAEANVRILEALIRTGHVEVRGLAVRRLAPYRTDEVNQFVLALADCDATDLRAEALRQLRERNLPGAMSRLRAALDDPAIEVREAAAEVFEDYTVDWFLNGFDSMDPSARRSNGEIVRRVDRQAAERLRTELEQGDRNRRLRAMSAAPLLDVMTEIQDLVVAQMREKDQFLRIEAIEVLAGCPTGEAREALNAALTDPMVSVREAAAAALERQAATRPRQADSMLLAGSTTPTGSMTETDR